jgi:hypothetical protein
VLARFCGSFQELDDKRRQARLANVDGVDGVARWVWSK